MRILIAKQVTKSWDHNLDAAETLDVTFPFLLATRQYPLSSTDNQSQSNHMSGESYFIPKDKGHYLFICSLHSYRPCNGNKTKNPKSVKPLLIPTVTSFHSVRAETDLLILYR